MRTNRLALGDKIKQMDLTNWKLKFLEYLEVLTIPMISPGESTKFSFLLTFLHATLSRLLLYSHQETACFP